MYYCWYVPKIINNSVLIYNWLNISAYYKSKTPKIKVFTIDFKMLLTLKIDSRY